MMAVRPKHYTKVVSLSPSLTEIIASDGDSSVLKGRTAACNYPPSVLLKVPIVASVKPDYEAITKIAPELILYDSSLYSPQDIDKLKATHADLFAIDAQTIDEFEKQLYTLGSMLGWETRFNDYIDRVDVEKKAAEASPLSPAPKVAIVMPGQSGDDYIAGTDSFLADVVKTCGGQLVGPKGSQFVPLNAESFVSLNPDVIITNGSKADLGGPALIANDPRFKTITAVKQGRIKAINSDVLLRRGQRVDELIKGIRAEISPDKK